MTRESILKILSLLKNSEHDFESLKLRLNIPSEHVKSLLEWGSPENIQW
ncbi:MAG: hypothetical protein QXH91_04365 [Candidatus Bathyarchaeia archaeon]